MNLYGFIKNDCINCIFDINIQFEIKYCFRKWVSINILLVTNNLGINRHGTISYGVSQLRNSDQHPLIAKRKNKIKSNLVSINDTLTKFGLYRRTSKNDSYEQKKNLIIIIINFQIYEK